LKCHQLFFQTCGAASTAADHDGGIMIIGRCMEQAVKRNDDNNDDKNTTDDGDENNKRQATINWRKLQQLGAGFKVV